MSETTKVHTRGIIQDGAFDGLTETQVSAAEMLQSGKYTKGEIAEICGVHPNTISRWCKNEKFIAAVKRCEQEKIRQTLALLNEGSKRATEILLELAECDDKRVKMEAVKYILDRNLGKTTSKIIVDDSGKDDKDVDIESALKDFREGKIAIGELPEND